MYSYRIYEQIIHINIPLKYPVIQTHSPDYVVLVKNDTINEQHITWIHDYDADYDFPWHRLGKLNSAYLFRFTGHADFLYNEKENLILCVPGQNTHTSTIEHLLLDQVLPRVLNREKLLVLHAGAITCKSGALAFIGKTGCGKSTLTAFYGQHGCPIITDDCLVLQQEKNQFLAFPSYPAIRLNPDMAASLTGGNNQLSLVAEYTSKMRLTPEQGGYVSHQIPDVVRALFVLAEPDKENASDSVCIERCAMRKAFSLLIENVFRLDPTDKQSITGEFKRLNDLVSTIPIYRLTYPRNQRVMSDVINATFDQLGDQ